jgi:hypothetical protein
VQIIRISILVVQAPQPTSIQALWSAGVHSTRKYNSTWRNKGVLRQVLHEPELSTYSRRMDYGRNLQGWRARVSALSNEDLAWAEGVWADFRARINSESLSEDFEDVARGAGGIEGCVVAVAD